MYNFQKLVNMNEDSNTLSAAMARVGTVPAHHTPSHCLPSVGLICRNHPVVGAARSIFLGSVKNQHPQFPTDSSLAPAGDGPHARDRPPS